MSEDKLVIVELGAFPQDAIPLSLDYQFKDKDGVVLDLTIGTWTGEAEVEQILLASGASQPANIGNGTVTFVVGTATATYAWHSADFATVGTFRMTIWIGNTINREGSKVHQWEVFDAPGSAPSV